MTATKKKLPKAQAITVDSLEALAYSTKPVLSSAPPVRRGYKYDKPVAVLIKFEAERRVKAYKIGNKEDKGFTEVVNDALELLLYSRSLIKEEDIKSPEIRQLIKAIYKPQKYVTSKKQKK